MSARLDALPAPRAEPARRRARRVGAIGQAVFLAAMLAFFLLPLWIMLNGSLKSMDELRHGSILTLPLRPTLSAWTRAAQALMPSFGNSLAITLPATLLSTVLGAVTAYAMSFGAMRWYGRHLFPVLLLAAFIPLQMFMYPFVLALAWTGMFGSLAGVWIVHVVMGLPLTTLLFRNHFDQLPRELIRAAQIDGADFLRIFRSIVVPLSLPMFAVVLLMQFTGIWNDYIVGLVFAGRENAPMTVALNNLVGSTFGERAYDVEMASALLTAALPLLVYFASGRMFVRGVLSGAVKG